jgi:hypothetical protein
MGKAFPQQRSFYLEIKDWAIAIHASKAEDEQASQVLTLIAR